MPQAIIILVISLFVSVYGVMHFYVYQKFLPLLPDYRRYLILLLSLLGGSVLLVEFLLHNNMVLWFVKPLAELSFSWMGLVFLFSSLSFLVDIVCLVSHKIKNIQVYTLLSSTKRTPTLGVIVLLIAIYGIFSAQQIQINRLHLSSSKISAPLQIVLITDLHLGLLSDEDYIRQIVMTVNSLYADLVVCSGDLVDMQMDHLDRLGKIMSELQSRLGKYAVLGNHEALAGVEESRSFIEKIGFTLLSNSGVTIDKQINLIGVDDPAVRSRMQANAAEEQELLRLYDNDLYSVLLKHQPSLNPASMGLFDLQLSGHTHGGQIFPFGLLIHLFYQSPFGLSKLGDDRWLYVSRGVGTWGPPMRVLASPEITLIEVQPE